MVQQGKRKARGAFLGAGLPWAGLAVVQIPWEHVAPGAADLL